MHSLSRARNPNLDNVRLAFVWLDAKNPAASSVGAHGDRCSLLHARTTFSIESLPDKYGLSILSTATYRFVCGLRSS